MIFSLLKKPPKLQRSSIKKLINITPSRMVFFYEHAFSVNVIDIWYRLRIFVMYSDYFSIYIPCMCCAMLFCTGMVLYL
jgi:hypothetical protein